MVRKLFVLTLVGQALFLFGLFVCSSAAVCQEKDKDKKEEKKAAEQPRYVRVTDDGSKSGNTTVVISGWRVQALPSKIIGAELTVSSEVKDGLTTLVFKKRKLRLEFSLPEKHESVQYWAEGTTTKRVVLAVPQGAAINPPMVESPKK